MFLLHQVTIKGDFILYGGVFNKHVSIGHATLNEEFSIEGGDFNEGIGFSGSILNKGVSITGGNFKNELRFNGYLNKVFINKFSSNTSLFFEVGSQINVIELENVMPKDTYLYFNTNSSIFKFNNFKNFGNIFLSDFTANVSWIIYNENTNIFTEKDKIIKPYISIVNSDLGKTTFINCNLSKFDLIFKSSKITEIFVAGTIMPNEIVSEIKLQKQLGYSQIKKIYDNRGDKVEANRYFALEMEAYWNTLHWFKYFWEWSNLGLNRISTFYGQSWQRGLASTLIVSVLLFFVYCLCLGIYPSFIGDGVLMNFGKVSSYYLEFINPIHKADYIAEQLLGKDVEVNNSARWVEGLSRIFIAYFLYQFIQAFRKYGKSSN